MSLLRDRHGILATAQAATGASANQVEVSTDAVALHIAGVSAGGNKAWTIEQSLDGGTTWVPVCEPGTVVAATDVPLPMVVLNRSAGIRIDNPVGVYRTNVSAFTAGTFDATYQILQR